LVTRSASGVLPKQIHTVLLAIRCKVFERVHFLAPILAEEMFKKGNVVHQNRLPFSLLLSFGQAKERRVWSGDQQQHVSV
jgi:hypothetical protein